MSDRERGYYYAQYRKAVLRDKMIEQKLLGIGICIIGILIQVMIGLFETCLLSIDVVAAGVWLIVTKRNMWKEVQG